VPEGAGLLVVHTPSGEVLSTGDSFDVTPEGAILDIQLRDGLRSGVRYAGSLTLEPAEAAAPIRVEYEEWFFDVLLPNHAAEIAAAVGEGLTLVAAGAIAVGALTLFAVSLTNKNPPLRTLRHAWRRARGTRLQRIPVAILGIAGIGALAWCVSVVVFGG
jgi:hypothetical protein